MHRSRAIGCGKHLVATRLILCHKHKTRGHIVCERCIHPHAWLLTSAGGMLVYKRGSQIPFLGAAHGTDILEFFTSIDNVAVDAMSASSYRSAGMLHLLPFF